MHGDGSPWSIGLMPERSNGTDGFRRSDQQLFWKALNASPWDALFLATTQPFVERSDDSFPFNI